MTIQNVRVATRKNFITKNGARIILFIFFLIFSSWLMFQTFSYDAKTHEIVMAFKIWSDFGAHIPLIRSFSMGDNWTRLIHFQAIQYPVFAGPPIRYHFLFDMLVGLLEKVGVRIDWALNIPSIAGFFGLIVLIYIVATELFQSQTVGLLSVIFFLFNGSLSFTRFFTSHPLSFKTLSDIGSVREFSAFAPWGSGEIAAFWNLNIYTNQRQLAPAFAVILLFILTLVRARHLTIKEQLQRGIIWGLVFAVFPYFHQPSLLIIAVFLLSYFLLYPAKRLFIFITGVVSGVLIIPQLLLTPSEARAVEWYPGFIIHNDLIKQPILQELLHLASFWWQNFGLHSILILIGFFLIPKRARNAILPIIPVFIIAILFKFSIEASANHKFFNFVLVLGQMISAALIVRIMDIRVPSKSLVSRLTEAITKGVVCVALMGFLTLSGVIDFFVIANDTHGRISDIPNNEIATWIAKNTPPSAIFLNSSYLYHPASIAGRNIFLGWPYFAWSAGYKENRMPVMNVMYETRNSVERCNLLKKYNITYTTVEDVKNDVNLPDIDLSYFLKTYTPIFVSASRRYAIFTTDALCPPAK